MPENKENTKLMPLTDLNPVELFSPESKSLDTLLSDIAAEAKATVQDVTTEEGRKEIASVAYKVARSKTAIDDVGKNHAAEMKKAIKIIDARRKFARDTLDALKLEIRKPLDDYEAAEAARIESHVATLSSLQVNANECAACWLTMDVDELEGALVIANSIDPTTFEEFEDRAIDVQKQAVTAISDAIDRRANHEREQKELEALRREKEEREEADRKAAAEQARKEREERIRQEAADKERSAAQEREEQLKRDKEAETQRAKEAEERAARAEQEAADNARREKEREAEEQAARERNTRHKGQVNSTAIAALMEVCNVPQETAKNVVTAIAKGKIPAVRIEY